MKAQDAASIRCIYAYLQQGTVDGQSAYLVKISRDGGATWEPLEYMGIAQSVPAAYKNTYDFLVNNEGYGLPVTRRLPYADYGLVLTQAVTGSPTPQTIQTASYGASHLGLEPGKFIHINPGGAHEEYVQVISVDPDNQTFDAIVTQDHAAGERIRPTIDQIRSPPQSGPGRYSGGECCVRCRFSSDHSQFSTVRRDKGLRSSRSSPAHCERGDNPPGLDPHCSSGTFASRASDRGAAAGRR
jgi:hypothetical protein